MNDHDFRSQADGIAIPHALYDMQRNIGYITIGTSREPSLPVPAFYNGG